MPEFHIEPEHKFRLGSSALAAIAALLALAKQIIDIVKDFQTDSLKAPQVVLALLFAALLFWAAGIARDALRSRSRVTQPEVLNMTPTRRDQLIDRDDDIRKLEKLCRDAAEVHLISKSGVGKSVLLQAGLIPELQKKANLLPIYINWWGGDWSDGPLNLLCEELWSALSADTRTKLTLTSAPDRESLPSVLLKIRSSAGVTPLIILDDIEEYLATHAQRFSDEQGLALSATQLAQTSDFFKLLQSLLQTNAGHILVARDPQTPFPQLTAQPSTYPLEKPTRAAMDAYLGRLPRAGEIIAIANPDRGWDQLCRRLLDAIEENRRVLPRSVSFLVRELVNLPRLTVPEFELAGGVPGIARSSLQRAIADIAELRACRPEILHDAIRFIAKRSPPSATAADTYAHLSNNGNTDIDIGTLTLALTDLAGRQILQATPARDSGSAWSIKHKLVATAVDALDQEPNRWLAVLKAGQAQSQSRSAPWRSWWQLLPPSTQVILAYHRARGEFAYGPYRRYAFTSVLRWIPYLLPAVLIAYIVVAERGWPLPGGRFIRDYLYVNHMSISQPIVSDFDIMQSAETARRELLTFLESRRKNSWFQPYGTDSPFTRENWIQAQATAAILRAPEQTPARSNAALQSLRDLHGQFITANGTPHGWSPDESAKSTSAEPLLWATAAYASGWLVMNDAEQTRTVPTLAEVNAATKFFRVCTPTESECAWNMFPNLDDPRKHSAYSSALALAALLDMRAAQIPWMEGQQHFTQQGHARRDRLIAATSSHLVRTFLRTKTDAGWRASPALDGPIDEGLTLQIYAVLLRARLDAGVQLTPQILGAIPQRLGQLVGVESTRATYTSWSWSGHKLRNHKGESVTTQTPDFRYLWYPWAMDCAVQWLRFASREPQPMADVVRVRRARDHLFQNELPRAVATAKNTLTFVGAETLYCLSSVPQPASGTEPRKGPRKK